MAKINLLPWRENLRQERQRNFMVALGVSAVLAIAAVFAVNYLVDRQIAGQEARNDYLRDEIEKLDEDIATIEELEQVRDDLLARKNVIERLQENRSMMVHLFNHLARTVPDGVRLTSVQQSGEELTIQGTSQSETRVSDYMRNIQAAPWLHEPTLRIIEAMEDPPVPDQPFEFELRVRVASPVTIRQEQQGLVPENEEES